MEKIHFPDYLKYTWVNTAYSDFINKFMRPIDSVAPVKKVLKPPKYSFRTCCTGEERSDLVQTSEKPKKLLKPLKSFGLRSKEGNKSKILLKCNLTICYRRCLLFI